MTRVGAVLLIRYSVIRWDCISGGIKYPFTFILIKQTDPKENARNWNPTRFHLASDSNGGLFLCVFVCNMPTFTNFLLTNLLKIETKRRMSLHLRSLTEKRKRLNFMKLCWTRESSSSRFVKLSKKRGASFSQKLKTKLPKFRREKTDTGIVGLWDKTRWASSSQRMTSNATVAYQQPTSKT